MARRPPSVARQVLALQIGVVVVLVAVSIVLAFVDARADARSEARERALAVASTVADSPTVVNGVVDGVGGVGGVGVGVGSSSLQPFAERVRTDTDVDFVVVMDLDRIRLTHPDPAEIGRRFVGEVGEAPLGVPFTQQYTGTLGPSVRAVVPVRDDAGEVVAMVAVGIRVTAIDRDVRDTLPSIAAAAVAVLAAGLAGAWLVSRRLRRQTHGLGEREITRMYEYYEAVLRAVREGLLLLDGEGRVQLANEEARRLLALPDDCVGRRLDDLGHDSGLAPGLVAAALGGTAEADDLYLAGDRVLVVSSAPATWAGREVGAVVTLRDHTELRAVTGELDAVRGMSETLRSQNHEAANRLHTVVSLVEMGRPEEAVEFAVSELQVAQRLTDDVVAAVDDPVVAALLLGKSAAAAERTVELEITGRLPRAAGAGVPARDLVTVLGNLVDNAVDAVTGRPERRVRVRLTDVGGRAEVSVADSGPGLDDAEAEQVLQRGWSTKAAGRGIGLALVQQVARRHGGDVVIDRSDLGGAEFRVVLGPRREDGDRGVTS